MSSSIGTAPLLLKSHSTAGSLCSSSTSISTITASASPLSTKTALKTACDLAHVRPARIVRACCAALLFAGGLAAVCVLLHWLANNGSAAIGIIQQSRLSHRHSHHRNGFVLCPPRPHDAHAHAYSNGLFCCAVRPTL